MSYVLINLSKTKTCLGFMVSYYDSNDIFKPDNSENYIVFRAMVQTANRRLLQWRSKQLMEFMWNKWPWACITHYCWLVTRLRQNKTRSMICPSTSPFNKTPSHAAQPCDTVCFWYWILAIFYFTVYIYRKSKCNFLYLISWIKYNLFWES